MRRMIFVIWFLSHGFTNQLQAQFAQVELFTGFDKTDFTVFSSYFIDKNKSFSINSLAFFQKFSDEENQVFDEVGVQPTVFWNITKNIAIGPSLYYNSFSGYSERLSAKFTFANTRMLFVLIPTIAHAEQTHSGYAEVFAQFQLNKPLGEKTSFWVNGQFLTVWDEFKTHSRSYQQLRIGIAFNGHQFGVGMDIDQYGSQPITKTSFGVYYRKFL